jgi:hypothetical protein
MVLAQHSTAWHGTAQHGTAWHGTAQHGTAFRKVTTQPEKPHLQPHILAALLHLLGVRRRITAHCTARGAANFGFQS